MPAELSGVECNVINRNQGEITLILTAKVAPNADYTAENGKSVSFICEGVRACATGVITDGIATVDITIPEDQVPFIGDDIHFTAKLNSTGHEVSGSKKTPASNAGLDHHTTETARRHYNPEIHKGGADNHVQKTEHYTAQQRDGIYATVLYWIIVSIAVMWVPKPFLYVQWSIMVITGIVACICFVFVIPVRYPGRWKDYGMLHLALNVAVSLAWFGWIHLPNK